MLYVRPYPLFGLGVALQHTQGQQPEIFGNEAFSFSDGGRRQWEQCGLMKGEGTRAELTGWTE
jgi:hypothetical protein